MIFESIDAAAARTLQERTKQLLPLVVVITRHNVMIVALNNKCNSHDHKLSSCNNQKKRSIVYVYHLLAHNLAIEAHFGFELE